MKEGLIVTASALLTMGVLFYVLIANSERSPHLHFTTREGAFKNVGFYSAKPPELPSQHTCDASSPKCAMICMRLT